MPRILYLLFSEGGLQGGHKMTMRHVEALRGLGFDASVYVGQGSQAPTWFEHQAPLELATPLRDDDIVVIPDDAPKSMEVCAQRGQRTVIISQNPYYFAVRSFEAMAAFPADAPPPFIAVAPGLARTIGRLFPGARVETVPAFADERLFRPGAEKRAAVVYAPKKRPLEAQVIRAMLGRLHPRHAGLEWREALQLSERELAAAFAGSTLCLSLSRLESLGMTSLEAMASGCLVAGFTGVGGAEYATPENGFWVADDDCEAAADALAQAADLAATGGPALKARLDAGYETARQWSHANFLAALEAAWMTLAPDARVQAGPLEP